jgi:bifunctional N-acetylglucosamine-1-phosphate-uridyltransferase/glucosamine-1-phosphate-acetyltransferase GlmU-like protein
VIENALKTYELAGIDRHVIVVGRSADKVMDEVCRTRPDVLFAYQREPRGTGDDPHDPDCIRHRRLSA